MSFHRVLEKYRKIAFSEHDKGARFERLMQAYLQTDPLYANKLKTVWMWNEFPGRKDLDGKDVGIDLVALTHEGDYWAIQCKCYQETTTLDKGALDSFLATSSRTFKNDEYKTVGFAHRLWISTTNHWGENAEKVVVNQNPPFSRISLSDLQAAGVDWEKLDQGIHGEPARLGERDLRPHQSEALEKAHAHFQTQSRGKLIMACGTGKTFTALRIAEKETNAAGLVLFLVPSIALLGQTLREWSTFAKEPINAICICSDAEVSRKRSNDDDSTLSSVLDLALPASTDVNNIVGQFRKLKKSAVSGMTVVFSTYQSIEVIAKAQKELIKQGLGFDTFDLIICDEAHRTTGVTLADEDESAFTKVHDDTFLKAKKRLYMTATPRLYADEVKSKAAQADAVLCSMDDPKLYGEEIYRIGFGEAVEKDLLTDYKVLILTLSEENVPPAIQAMIADKTKEINTDDASKLIGCINALSKQILGDEGIIKATDPDPMRRAVAFCQKIPVSKKITDIFNETTDVYISSLPTEQKEQMVSVASKHIDGSMSAPKRDELLSWLKAETETNECRVLTNVRCLSEGVDVPSLDAVLFLSARNSQVDVVQSVGRVMRKSPGKKYGYIIIPVVVPSDVPADKALDDNERYKVVWTVLNALRAHDDRFNATVNKIELNKKRPSQILVGTAGTTFGDDSTSSGDGTSTDKKYPRGTTETPGTYTTAVAGAVSAQMALRFEEIQKAMFARMVLKVGDRRYWEQWAKDVAQIAEQQGARIARLVADTSQPKHQKAFADFLGGLQKNINPSITHQEAVEMLAQHIITRPVFEALFEGYSFVKSNPISVSMQTMLDALDDQAFDKDTTETLQRFYDSVKKRAADIDNAEGKQRIIIELYDKFFKTAFPKMVEKLGIVYTPVEVVDFIIHSVNDVLKKEFGRSLSDENIHILDPFTGTGTFITRLLQSGLIDKKDLPRKYQSEIHANEIVLLAYYIAAVNIENAYHDAMGEVAYSSFDGICLTDTFQLGEQDDKVLQYTDMFPKNSERVTKQKNAPLRVIIGNPPYSVGQKSANDNAQNQKYEKLDNRISQTYAHLTDVTNKNSLYNSYFKAFRWSTDRIIKNNASGGIICFVTDGGWIDNNSQEGFRKSLENEFSSIYVFNLRGNARTSGELRRKEAGNVFGGGSRTTVAITLLVRKPNSVIGNKSNIYYYDIGDYLSKEQKLVYIDNFRTVSSEKIEWLSLKPNEHGDWISVRNSAFETFIELGEKNAKNAFFIPGINSRGLETGRDSWVYNSSKHKLLNNMEFMIQNYNNIANKYILSEKKLNDDEMQIFIDNNPRNIKWTTSLVSQLQHGNFIEFNRTKITKIVYRPYFKQLVYNGEKVIHRRGKNDEIFPAENLKNIILSIPGSGSNKDFYILATNCMRDVDTYGGCQCFPLYYYEERKKESPSLFDTADEPEYIQRDGISNFILERAQKQYGKSVTKEDIFYYVYGFLHSPEYRETFASDLKKMLPRLPLLEAPADFWAFSKAGRKLADLHINYETVPPHPDVKVTGDDSGFYRVEKMRFPKKDQKDTILYNSKITVSNIPEKAYEYVVNGKSAIEWVMERYAITTHKESGITNDPNDWADEVGNPRYILDLVLSIVHVSTQTVDIVAGLPKLTFTE